MDFQVSGSSLFSVKKDGSFTALTGTLTTLASDATHTDKTVCADSTTGLLYGGSGTLGICLGTSSARFKNHIVPLREGLRDIMLLRPISYRYNSDPNGKDLFGFTAEQVNTVTPRLVGLDKDGRPNSVDMVGMIPMLINAIQTQQAQIEQLKFQVNHDQSTGPATRCFDKRYRRVPCWSGQHWTRHASKPTKTEPKQFKAVRQ